MNKLLVIYACTLIGGSPIAEEQESTVPLVQPKVEMTRSFESSLAVLTNTELKSVEDQFNGELIQPEEMTTEFVNKELISVEIETETLFEENELKNSFVDLNTIDITEVEPEIELGFDTASYLPDNFDPYSDPADIHSIDFIEDEEINLGFDTEPYLPEGFNPYETYFNIHEVEIFEVEEELDIEAKEHLPTDFNPYVSKEMNIHSIDFIEEDEIALGFDTKSYLPEEFDPYARSN